MDWNLLLDLHLILMFCITVAVVPICIYSMVTGDYLGIKEKEDL